jgi:double-stranded uracil-DNA glycosylase
VEARRPTRDELAAARSLRLDDVLAPGLDVVFCGINPGLYTAWAGHHFARPGNRFWKALANGGFTPRVLQPSEQGQLPGLGVGITNLVARTTARADELTAAELREGAEMLRQKIATWSPRWLAMLGVTAYRVAFGDPRAAVGPQAAAIGSTRVWLLPNPSGLNAHYQLPQLADEFARLRSAVRRSAGPAGPVPRVV